MENKALEQRSEKNLNDVNSFDNHINNIKEMITYFKDENHISADKYKNYKILNTILESVDTIFFTDATSTSISLSITGFGLFISAISAEIACTLSSCNQVSHKITLNKYNRNKKQYEKDQKTNQSFDNFYRTSLQDNITDKHEKESLCNSFSIKLDESKIEFFFECEHKNKINFF